MRYDDSMSVLSRRTRTETIRRTNEDALLQATIQLLEDAPSFADLGIEQIVKQAGLSRPTFYTYFRDKRDLVLKLGQTLRDDLATVTAPWFDGEDTTTRETISAVFDVFSRHRGALKAITEAATYDPDVTDFWRAFHDNFVPEATKRITAGDPTLPPEAVTARAYALVYMTERTLTEHLARQLTSDEALIDQLAWLWAHAVSEPATPDDTPQRAPHATNGLE
jgi:AcrR family transcriptional regulator